jgi:CheY-like chemotaxis protein
MRVLLVEDSDSLRRLFARVLMARGYEVHEAADGLEALGCLHRFVPDLVLTDLMMPGLDGFELIRRVRTMPDLAEVPVVAMTAGASSEAEREARLGGASDYLAKPIDAHALLNRLGRYC